MSTVELKTQQQGKFIRHEITTEEGTDVLLMPVRRNLLKEPFLRVFKMGLDVYIQQVGGGANWKVLAWILNNIDFQNSVIVNRCSIARTLQMNRNTVNAAIVRLQRIDAIRLTDSETGMMMVNPLHAIKCRNSRHCELVGIYNQVSSPHFEEASLEGGVNGESKLRGGKK